MIHTMKKAENLIYQSYLRSIAYIKENDDSKVKKPQLTRELFDMLGSPDHGQRFILVTGSKGKGSTSRFIASLLSNMGLKVGLFTSPHLVHFNERIRINGQSISDKDFIRLANNIEKPFTFIESKLSLEEYQGPIGLIFAIAALYFKENKTDINVIECGRGGLYDDTNIVNNEYAVITPIMEEHVLNLGPSIDQIISHKLGIVKSSTRHIVISKQYHHENVQKIDNELANKSSAKTSYYGKEFNSEVLEANTTGTVISVRTNRHYYPKICLPILGGFQAINVATAIKVCEDVLDRTISYEDVSKCFSSIRWPGRCEIIDTQPTVIIDGAINASSAQYIKTMLGDIKGKNIVSIIGVPVDKDYKGVINILGEISQKMIITKPDISHLLFPKDALQYAQSILPNSIETNLLIEAVEIAKKDVNTSLILIVGTQTLLANAKRIWKQSLLNIGL